MTSFGAKIRANRELQQISMSDVAKEMGVSVVYYSDIERGRRNPPTGDKLHKIAKILRMDNEEVEAWANKERGRVELELKAKDGPITEAALMLAKRWDDITDQEASGIMKILTRKSRNEKRRTGTKCTTQDGRGNQ